MFKHLEEEFFKKSLTMPPTAAFREVIKENFTEMHSLYTLFGDEPDTYSTHKDTMSFIRFGRHIREGKFFTTRKETKIIGQGLNRTSVTETINTIYIYKGNKK